MNQKQQWGGTQAINKPGKSPSAEEIAFLFLLINQGRIQEAQDAAVRLVKSFPKNVLGWNALGIVLRSQGRLDESLKAMQKVAVLMPLSAEAHNNVGVTLSELGRLEKAEISYRRAVKINPDYAEAHSNLGNTLKELGRMKDAEACYRRALKIKPTYAEAHSNLGITLKELGRLEEAETSCRCALEINPDYAEANINLGRVLTELGQLEEAEASFRRGVEINPVYADAYFNLGNNLFKQNRLEEAEASFRRTIELKPSYAEAHFNLGNIVKLLDRLEEAEACYRRALLIKPNYAEAHCNLGKTIEELGWPVEAAASYQRALEIKPNYSDAYLDLGIVQDKLERLEEAEATYRRALKMYPDFAYFHCNLGNILYKTCRLEEAAVSLGRAREINPDIADVHRNIGIVYKDLGRLNDAEISLRRALELKPDFLDAYSSLLFTLNYATARPLSELFEMACAWEVACVPEVVRAAARERQFNRAPLTGRRLRVGYVSNDFVTHSISYFVEQLFSNHDAARVEVFAYSVNPFSDPVTKRLEALAEHWIPVVGFSDQQLFERIEADKIDLLIDLSGHTSGNRLTLFALRAAPVQAHWLGYFATTGLTEMDYWIGDPVLIPPESDCHFSETVWRLPRTWISYKDNTEAPDSCWQPAQDGVVWLGSFNNLVKLTPATITLWAKVLHTLPEARLLLKARELTEIRNRQRILDAFNSQGIGSERIELQDTTITVDRTSHMAYYDRLDIALDPIEAVGGGTTSCDALWMGVPVISLIGDRMASRMTASMLDAVGRAEWLATSEDEYVAKVVALAHDVEGRKVMRANQRARVASSPLCDAKGLARAMEDAFEAMFERWYEKTKNQKEKIGSDDNN